MAHHSLSLSSPPSFHSYSSGSESQRHAASYRQPHRNEMVTKERNHTRIRLSSLKGKSWTSFYDAVGYESSDEETDGDTADDSLAGSSSINRQRGSIVRLKKHDFSLYGRCPKTDSFTVVSCRICHKVLKTPALKSHVERHRHEKERKHELGDAVVKLEKLSSTSEKLAIDKTVTEKFDKISVIVDKHEKAGPSNSSLCANPMDKIEKVEKTTDSKRHRNFQRKSTPSENSNDAVHFEAPSQQTAPTLSSTTESSSASNSPKPRPRKRKIIDDPVEAFQNTPTACRIIVEPSEIVIRDPSSPPPLALLSKGGNNYPIIEPQPSVWIVTPASPAVIIDGSFVVKPLETQETESEIDLKDLKLLKPLVKETQPDCQPILTLSNWYANQPRPLALNCFNMRKLDSQRYMMATQRKNFLELGRNLRTEEKVVGGKVQPKTWSFIERSQVFIPFRVTH